MTLFSIRTMVFENLTYLNGMLP